MLCRVFRCATPLRGLPTLSRSFAITAACAGPKQPPSKDAPASHTGAPDLAAKQRCMGQSLVEIGEEVREVDKQRLIKSTQAHDKECARNFVETKLSEEAKNRTFEIDPTTPQPNARLEDPHTAVKTRDEDNDLLEGSIVNARDLNWVTLRASQPLTTANHRWAVRIHEGSIGLTICLGLIPKLSADIEAEMGSSTIEDLGGWCIFQHYDTYSSVYGDWQCAPLPFGKGDLVLFDYSFQHKTLTIRCGRTQVVGRIPTAGEGLYPAFSFVAADAKVSFEIYPSQPYDVEYARSFVEAQLLEDAKNRNDLRTLLTFEIDPTTPLPNARLEDPQTAVKTGEGWLTLRSSQPLTTANHRWAVRIHDISNKTAICLGLLPKLPAWMEVKIRRSHIDQLGGWCIFQGGNVLEPYHTAYSNVYGDWQCAPLPFGKGDLVLFDYSFQHKTLTIRCGRTQVVGRIPTAGEGLYPAFSFYCEGTKIGFETYP